jgi:transposase InsO family protein
VYAAIEAIVADTAFATTSVCDTLAVCRSAYYAWRDGASTRRDPHEKELKAVIAAIFWQHRRRYGARRIVAELADRGIRCSPRRVAGVLQSQGLRAIQPRSFVPRTTDSRHRWGYSPNLILDAPDPVAVDQLWVGDITYLPIRRGGFVYLAALMDRFSRDIVGWHVASHMKEPLVLAALRQAIRVRQPRAGLVHHTDRGGQYAGGTYRAVLQRSGILQSMSRADNCYDNAFMESCWGTFKTEMANADYDSEAAARDEVSRYVYYYRFERKHSSLGYLTPAKFARLTTAKLVC